MKEIAISKFKATCLAVVEEVRRNGEPVRITRFGRPMAEIVPPGRASTTGWVGSLAGTGEILADVVAPALDAEDWGSLE